MASRLTKRLELAREAVCSRRWLVAARGARARQQRCVDELDELLRERLHLAEELPPVSRDEAEQRRRRALCALALL